jgi:RNA processing factor Prp31
MTGYVITDANKSVWVNQDSKGAYSLTTDKNKAIIFDSKVAADTVFKSNLSKLIKSKGVAVKSVTLQIAGADNQPKAQKIIEVDRPEPQVEVGSAKYIASVLSDAVAKLNCRHMMLVDEQSKYDRQLTDVEHYIEFNAGKLNACDGYKAYKLLQDVLVQRRKVKDEIQIMNMVMDRVSIPEDLDDKINELESRKYEPREFKYLFETKE